MSERTDTERLDWIEKMRADIFGVVTDEWDATALPELLRFSVNVDFYKTRDMPGIDGQEGGFGNLHGEDVSLRTAIDKAMDAGARVR